MVVVMVKVDILIITTSSGSVPNNFIFIGFGGSLPMNIPHFSHVFNQLNLIFVALHGPTNKTQSSGGGFYYFWDSVPSRFILLSSSSSILQRLLWRWWRCCSPHHGGFVIKKKSNKNSSSHISALFKLNLSTVDGLIWGFRVVDRWWQRIELREHWFSYSVLWFIDFILGIWPNIGETETRQEITLQMITFLHFLHSSSSSPLLLDHYN